ncbi:MAG: efflux transporter outer membrane subunit [Opitutaceae bacterium]
MKTSKLVHLHVRQLQSRWSRASRARSLSLFTLHSSLFLLAGCATVGLDYEPPTATVSSEWTEAGDAAFAAEPRDSAAWWTELDDPVLDRLIARSIDYGPDLREALARLTEARALRGIAGSAQFPTLDSGVSYQRRGESERTPTGALTNDSHLYSAGLDAAWELDLWGRVRRSVEAAEAGLAASSEDVRAVALTVAAETALNYIELRAFQTRLAIARTNVELQEQTLALVQARFDAGLVGERDLAQAATNVAVTRSRVPALETGWRAAENRLSVLAGVPPGQLANELDVSTAIPVPPVTVAIGLPADLIRNRPDVRRAERLLAAEHARIGLATGDLYPRLALSGSLGLAADDASDLLNSGSDFFGIGPSIRWNLFDRSALHNRIAAQDARTEQALVRWERAILGALEEAETAMTAFVREQSRRSSLQEAATQARRAVELAQFEYNEGLSDFQAVLDSERALAQLEDDLAQTGAAITIQYIVLQKALGDS